MIGYSRIKKSSGLGWQLIGAAALIAGCASQPKPPPATVPPPPQPVLDASYDWHALLVAPFGTALRDIHFTLHEVLLFNDQARSAAPADDAECYAIEGTTPQFLQHAASEYLLCFRHDRLARIEAAVQLPVDRAPRNFADACGLWLRNAAAGAKPDAPAGATLPSVDTCEGVQAAISFSARLDPGDTDSLLSITLNAADAVLELR